MLEHYSHIRIDAKRQTLDAPDDVPRAESNGNGARLEIDSGRAC
jgi:hypothetical protein